MRVQDLIARLSPGCEEVYANDLEAYMNRKIPFHSWNKDGEASTDLDDKAKYYYKELFMRTETAYYTQDEQFIRYCGLASAATYPQKELYSVLARFFDREVEEIDLYFRVDDKVDITAFVDMTKQAKADWKSGKVLVGGHPLKLYETWVLETQLAGPLRKAGMLKPPYEYIKNLEKLKEGQSFELKYTKNNFQKVFKIPVGDFEHETSTTVTRLKVNLARNMTRDPTQAEVMGIGSDDAAMNVWQHSIGSIDDAEWLRRSAFSYGGLGDKRSSASSSQVREKHVPRHQSHEYRHDQVRRNFLFLRRALLNRWPPESKNPKQVLKTSQATWLALVLEYNFASSSALNKFQPQTLQFDARQRLTQMRFEFELGRLVDANYFGWELKTVEEDFETPKESEQKDEPKV
ncbi:MAG: hypothetical protein MMC33_002073 [Icmadophila ericetorum]|nr:hypothetical protein [Icmadophila ericetorum]